MKITSICTVILAATLGLFSPGRVCGGTTTYTYDRAGRLLLADYGGNQTASFAYDNAGNLLFSSAAAPGLFFDLTPTGQLILSWPALPGQFSLQNATVLGAGAAWSAVSVTPVRVGDLMVATIPIGPVNLFYRLAK